MIYERRHPCKYCGRQWCKCHHNPKFRYPSYTPDDYINTVRGGKENVI